MKKKGKKECGMLSCTHPAVRIGYECVSIQKLLNSFSCIRRTASNANKSRAVGIDLGTTNSCVAVIEHNTATVIGNTEGSRTTPSIVAFGGNGERFVGITAKRQAVTNPKNTIFAVKRLIGRRFDDVSVQKELKNLPYCVQSSPHGDAWINVEGKMMSPSQISAMILQKMRESAESHLGVNISEAVITVPAYFDDIQRQATKDAGKIAGLNVLRIINEPTAAALAFEKSCGNGKTIAVYDLGGGTFDISILELNDGVFEVKATNGNSSLGGEDFDNRIVNYLLQQLSISTNEVKDPIMLQRLREAAETAKHELSTLTETEVNLPFLFTDAQGRPAHLKCKLSRSKLDELCADLIRETIGPCEKCLKDAGLKPTNIHEVILVGGMTRMPKIVSTVESIFKKPPSKGVNPDEAVALGAAIQAGVLKGDVKDVLLLDVTPLSLGIETMGGVFSPLIERNTTIPARRSALFSTAVDNQDRVGIRVFQGERELAAKNRHLGQFDLCGIPPAPRGVPQIEVIFDIDANGILNVSAVDKTTAKKQEITIQSSGGLSQEEIQAMIKEAEQHKKEDESVKELMESRNTAESLLYRCKQQAEDMRCKMSRDESDLLERCMTALEDGIQSDNVANIRVAMKSLQETSWELSRKYYGSTSR